MAPTVWAVNIAQWNTEPYSRIQPRDAPPSDEACTQFGRDLDALVRPYDATGADKVLRYLRVVDRVRSFVARILPRLYCVHEGLRWEDVQVHTAPGGRPYLALEDRYIDFNLSHDGDWVVMGVTKTPGVRMGVDVMEVALPSFEESSASFCQTMEQSMTAKERGHVLSDDNEQRILQRLLDVWTYKEAYTKSIGVGLGYDFRQVEVAFWKEPIEVWSHGKQVEAIQWTQVRLPPAREGAAPSQVVIAMDGSKEPRRTISGAEDAAKHGWLRIWSYDALVHAAHEAQRRGPSSAD
ncbi:hypothetical protein CBS14141_000914 [Malassezia furfur]|nr:hypothetical protein CBS14141_000914 [Malassezia furfur]